MHLIPLLSIVLSVSAYSGGPPPPSDGPKQSGWALTYLQNQLHALEGAIKTNNRQLFIKLFKVYDPSDEDALDYQMRRFRGYDLKTSYAFFDGTSRIEGTFFNGKNNNYTTWHKIVIEKDFNSPTGWQIVKAARMIYHKF
ncbi:hypothetical protein L3Y34_019143 [Caenorhabditis briggsae]|uniref:Secreted protein n=1 Tax=Caenorhabditis briggsae TaxID=6238 RepID=A0AAE9DM60_CAEBR|nr:hypothetical protein L3Y34_019143 [Caenorhabditis briggsae]